ncbi:MAG: DUF3025 domain-containing protein, partial [Gammaproteobacteria bacterium]|nr:DUF3025 domain-containing protein [Gammaproteobacteria bacterium]
MFQPLDWRAPWLEPYEEFGRASLRAALAQRSVSAGLNAASAAAIAFVPQSELPPSTAYEQFIFDTRTVPTRDNLHDFFNGLVWLQFPETKRRLNQLQAQAIAADGVQ